MSESGESASAPVTEERPIAEGQEAEVPSTATMRSQPREPPTVPPEPCLEPRPPVVGASDTAETKPLPQQTQVPTKPEIQASVPPHSSPVVPQQHHFHPAVPSHIHGGPGSGPKISPLAQMQFAKPAPKPHPGVQGLGSKAGQKLTPEQIEEAKLRSKYGKLNKPGGSDFLRMRLNKGGQKYFDSGDYNMAKSKGKIGLRATPIATKPGLPRPVEATTGDTIPTPASIPHRKTSSEISKLAV